MSDIEWTWELASNAQDDLGGLSPSEQDRIKRRGGAYTADDD